jgi:septal ring factor EnvC (AmiA/AmiB activator)
VWVQLLQELCSRDSNLTPYISALAEGVAQSRQELQAQQELVQQQAVQLAAQAAQSAAQAVQLAEQEQEAAEQQRRIAQLERQLAAQQEAHARGIAEMQGQLQQLLQTLQQG